MGKKKKQSPNKIPAFNKHLKKIWIDGCYFDQTGETGGAIVVDRPNGKVEKVLCFALDNFDITESKHAELWTLVIALKQFQGGEIGAVYFDNPDVLSAISRVRKGGRPKHTLPEDLKSYLQAVIEAHPKITPMHVGRGEAKMQMADNYAKAAAGDKRYKLDKVSNKYHNPKHRVLDLSPEAL